MGRTEWVLLMICGKEEREENDALSTAVKGAE